MCRWRSGPWLREPLQSRRRARFSRLKTWEKRWPHAILWTICARPDRSPEGLLPSRRGTDPPSCRLSIWRLCGFAGKASALEGRTELVQTVNSDEVRQDGQYFTDLFNY